MAVMFYLLIFIFFYCYVPQFLAHGFDKDLQFKDLVAKLKLGRVKFIGPGVPNIVNMSQVAELPIPGLNIESPIHDLNQ